MSKQTKQKIAYLLTVLFSCLYIFLGNKIATKNNISRDSLSLGVPEKVQVTQVLDDNYEVTLHGDDASARSESIILFTAKFLNGYKKGEEVRVVQRIDSMYAIELRHVKAGDKIIVYANPDESIDVKYMFAEFYRVDFLIFLAAAFCVLLVVFGKSKGVNTLISLVFTVISIFYVFIPAVLNNGNIYFWSICTCVFIILMTLLIVSGFTRKSLAAMSGCFSGVCVSGALVLIFDHFVHMTGLVNEDSMYLLLLNDENPISIKAVIFAAIIIGAIGAIMDVSMSISASLAELKEQVGHMSGAQITKSGLVIGRDIMGTMANTLILAYIGSSLSVTLLLVAYNSSVLLLFNTEMIIVELLQAIAGSFGILLTIPLTSVICGILYADKDVPQ
ncbi:MAG: YibE/F family protein [Oscillospiraceae bacterium]